MISFFFDWLAVKIPKIFSPTLIIIRPLCLYLYWWQIFFDEDVFVFFMNESDSGDDDEGRVWLWGISELQCLSLFTQISIFNVYIDFCFFDVCIIICFFLMFTPFSVFSAISTSAFFVVLHHHMLFNVYANFVFFNFIYAPLFFQCLHRHLFF